MTINNKILQKLIPFPIKQSLRIGEITIVLFDDDKVHGRGDKTLNQNVYAFDSNGKLVWKINEAPDGGDEWPKPYTSIKLDDGTVTVHNWIGTDYLLNIRDGSVHFYGAARRPW